MKYLKKFNENFDTEVNEKITDYFKSREDIANKFLELVKNEPVKALNSILPYYMDFIEDKLGSHRTDDEASLYGPDTRLIKLLPTFYQLFKKDGKGTYPPNYIVDETKLKLVSKITKEEVLNLISTHENFSLKKIASDIFSFMGSINPAHVYKDVPSLDDLKTPMNEFLSLNTNDDVEVSKLFGYFTQQEGYRIEDEIISTLRENDVIKRIISNWSNRFKSSIDKNEVTHNHNQTLSSKIYQAAKNVIDVKKSLGLPNSYTYGSILKDVINRRLEDIIK